MTAHTLTARFGSGKSVRRVEDDDLLTGRDRFADNFSLPGQCHLAFVRSPHAHARILSIDASSAKAMEGVVAIVTGAELAQAGVKPLVQSADFKRANGQPTAAPPQHAMAIDTARFAGEIVAAVG